MISHIPWNHPGLESNIQKPLAQTETKIVFLGGTGKETDGK